jgi:hypothetical protein
MHEHRTTANRAAYRKPPSMGPALAAYAVAYFSGGARYSPRLADLLYDRIQKWGADVVAAQAREVCQRIADSRED